MSNFDQVLRKPFDSLPPASFEFQFKATVTMPTMLVNLGSFKDAPIVLVIDMCPCLLPAPVGTVKKDKLLYILRVVIRGMEYQSEFIEEPETLPGYIADVLQELQMLGKAEASVFSIDMLAQGEANEDYHRTAPDGSIYVDLQLSIECSREVMMEFVGLARMAVQATFGGPEVLAATLAAEVGKSGAH